MTMLLDKQAWDATTEFKYFFFYSQFGVKPPNLKTGYTVFAKLLHRGS